MIFIYSSIYFLHNPPRIAFGTCLLAVYELIFVTKILKINKAAILEGALVLEILCIMIAVKVIKACSDARQQTQKTDREDGMSTAVRKV